MNVRYVEMHASVPEANSLLVPFVEYTLERVARGVRNGDQARTPPLGWDLEQVLDSIYLYFYAPPRLRTLNMWASVDENDRIVGCMVSQITTTFGLYECAIYMLTLDSEPGMTHDRHRLKGVLDQVEQWAAGWRCSTMTCTVAVEDAKDGRFRSARARLFERNFGFKPVRLLMQKEVRHDRHPPIHNVQAG